MDISKREVWKAALIGVGIATVVSLIPLVAFEVDIHVSPNQNSDIGNGVALLLCLLAIPTSAIIGGIAGALLLRERKSASHVLWVIPCVVGMAAIIIYQAIKMG